MPHEQTTDQQEQRLDKHLFSRVLAWCLGIAYSFWATILLSLEVQHRTGVQHFAYIPFVAMAMLMALAALSAVFVCVWRMLRGVSRWRTVGWLCAMMLPVAFWIYVGATGYINGRNRYVPNNYPMNTSIRLAASLMEAELAWRYPPPLRGQRVVMFHERVAQPQDDVAKMDEYIEELEHTYGRRIEVPIHWVRGKLLGRGRFSIYGLALGTDISQAENVDGREVIILDPLDRHEVAHAVMAQWQSPNSDAPMLLREGWAEANANPDLHQSAIDLVSLENVPPKGFVLSTLLGPEWYYQDSGLVYPCGRHFVLFLLDRYGVEKFFELWNTIRHDNVENAFQETYGITVATLEHEMFEQIAILAASPSDSSPNPYMALRVKGAHRYFPDSRWLVFPGVASSSLPPSPSHRPAPRD